VDLSLSSGGVTALLGPTGSGKTRILRLLAGLEKPDRGEIRRERIHGKTGFVFQNPNLVPWLSGEENLRLCLQDPAREKKMNEWIAQFSLQDHLGKKTHQLSGGQRQKFNLLRGFLNAPSLLLMDEPFTGLDPVQKQNLYEIFFELRAETAVTVLLVTHDIDEALLLADRIFFLSPRQRKLSFEMPNPLRASGAAGPGAHSMMELHSRAEYLPLFARLDSLYKTEAGA
jgi:ABC-type nitrate/sulfonate/bicarbonate transport system ATPase subunit